MKQRSAGKPDIELGKRIRLRRVEQKISQAELGDKLGVSFQQVQKYEKGVNRVGAGRLTRIAEVLGVLVLRGVIQMRQRFGNSIASHRATPAFTDAGISWAIKCPDLTTASVNRSQS